MADSKISALTDGGNLQLADQVAIARAGVSYRAVPLLDGWIDDTAETWTYVSGSGGGVATFTIGSDVHTKYVAGTRIKLTQTTVKYFVVTTDATFGSGVTTVTILGGSDYTLANAAISANYHSYSIKPQGYPTWFNYGATQTGWSGTPTITARFALEGRICFVDLRCNGTSTTGATTLTAPVTASNPSNEGAMIIGPTVQTDNGAALTTPGRAIITSNTTTITFGKDWSGTVFTTSGTKTVQTSGFYLI